MTSFNPPPNWPEPAEPTWEPPAGWTPDPSWPKPPAGWALEWEHDDTAASIVAVEGAENVRATSARPQAPATYPIEVDLPGRLTKTARANSRSQEYKTSRFSSRAWTVIAAVVGLLAIIATIVAFIWLYNFAITSLPSQEAMSLSTPLPVFGRDSGSVHA